MIEQKTSPPPIVANWLTAIAVIIAVMVTVGGATRLTDSGLSITEWDLVTGTIPPLSEAAWEAEMDKYRQIPEYQRVNAGMSMAAFQEIYWWEWGHRALGRFIGLAVLIPLIWFSWKGVVTGGLRWRLWGLFGLVCLQGALGWFMVASGLSDRVDVSQYRLALHLGTAFVLFALIVWQILDLQRPAGQQATGRGLYLLSLGVIAASAVQIILGAFVAGLRAGKSFNTWPLMDGRFVPEGYWGGQPALADLFERIPAVQFNHRIGAYALLAVGAWFAIAAWRAGAKRHGVLTIGALTVQALLGIWTVVAAVPLWLGLVHQLGALVLVAILVRAAYDLYTPARQTGAAIAAA